MNVADAEDRCQLPHRRLRKRNADHPARHRSRSQRDHLDYRPDAKSKTGFGLVRHIALEDEWLLNCIANGAFTPPPDDSDTCGVMSPADAVARYKGRFRPPWTACAHCRAKH